MDLTELKFTDIHDKELEEPPGVISIETSTETDPFQLIKQSSNQTQEKNSHLIGDKTQLFKQKYFANVSEKDWNNWHWQVKNSFTSLHELSRIIDLDDQEIKPEKGNKNALPIRITPYYLSLFYDKKFNNPLRKSMVPLQNELTISEGERSDPLAEGYDSPIPNLVHRYPDRALFLSTGFCSAYCRYCTRSHMVAKQKCHVGIKAWEPALEYLRKHTEIRDVVVSGGDPLTMPDTHIEYLLKNLREIPHIEIIRIGTKVPAVLPMRITKNLLSILKKYHPLLMSVHFTHPDELTPEAQQACIRLANAGIPLGSQTVLLKNINDNAETMTELMHGLLKIRVRPYYLYQCDPILGSSHFRTPVQTGIDMIKALRGFTSGYAVPQYVIDAPNGGGKIPLIPDYFQGKKDNYIVLKNFEDKLYKYPDFL